MENKLSKRLWLNIVIFSLMGGVAWNLENMYFNTFLYGSIYEGVSAEWLHFQQLLQLLPPLLWVPSAKK